MGATNAWLTTRVNSLTSLYWYLKNCQSLLLYFNHIVGNTYKININLVSLSARATCKTLAKLCQKRNFCPCPVPPPSPIMPDFHHDDHPSWISDTFLVTEWKKELLWLEMEWDGDETYSHNDICDGDYACFDRFIMLLTYSYVLFQKMGFCEKPFIF